MELNLCPACGAFIRGTWTSCQACGVDLGVPAAAETETVATDATWENTEVSAEGHLDEHQAEATEVFFDVPVVENNTDFDAELGQAEVVAEAPVEQKFKEYEQPAAEPFELAGALNAKKASLSNLFDDPSPAAEARETVKEGAGQPGAWETSFDGAEPSFTAFSFFESDDDTYNSEYAALAGGAPLDSAHNLTIAPIEKKERSKLSDSAIGSALTSRKSLLIVGAIAGVIGLISVLSFLTVLFFNSSVGNTPVTTTPTIAVADDWQTYTAPMDLFTVKLPSEPTTKTDGDSVLMRSLVPNSEAAVEVYAVKLNPTRDKSGDQALLQVQLNATALDRGSSVSSSAFQTIDKTRYLSAHFASGTKNLNGDAQFFIKGNTLYAAWLLTPSDAGDPGVFSKLFDGFTPVNAG